MAEGADPMLAEEKRREILTGLGALLKLPPRSIK